MNSTDPFEAIVDAHYEALFRFALSLTQSESDARDLTQHTFYTWARKGDQLRDRSKVKTWLFTTLHRAFLESRRRQVRFPHHELEKVSGELPFLSPRLDDRMDAIEVLSALARVDEIFQAAVALAYLEDRSYKDIAAILEVPIGTVKSRVARGIEQLKRILSAENSHRWASARPAIAPSVGAKKPSAPPEVRFLVPPSQFQFVTGSGVPSDPQWG